MRTLAASAAVLPSVHIAWRSASVTSKWLPPRSAKITQSQRPPAENGVQVSVTMPGKCA